MLSVFGHTNMKPSGSIEDTKCSLCTVYSRHLEVRNLAYAGKISKGFVYPKTSVSRHFVFTEILLLRFISVLFVLMHMIHKMLPSN